MQYTGYCITMLIEWINPEFEADHSNGETSLELSLNIPTGPLFKLIQCAN